MLTGHFEVHFGHLKCENDPKMFSIQKLVFDICSEFYSDRYETWYICPLNICTSGVVNFNFV